MSTTSPDSSKELDRPYLTKLVMHDKQVGYAKAAEIIDVIVKPEIALAVQAGKIEEYKRHFIPHGNNQLETVFYLPGKRLSVWGTTDARKAYNLHIATLTNEKETKYEVK